MFLRGLCSGDYVRLGVLGDETVNVETGATGVGFMDTHGTVRHCFHAQWAFRRVSSRIVVFGDERGPRVAILDFNSCSSSLAFKG